MANLSGMTITEEPLVMPPTVDLDLDVPPPALDQEPPKFTHIVKRKRDDQHAGDLVMSAMIEATPVEALCGHVFVPTRDPKKLPLCDECRLRSGGKVPPQ